MPRNTPFSKVGGLFCLLSLSFLQTSCITETNKKSNSTLESAKVSSEKDQKKTAKNIILFIGDGMGVSTITAGRIFDGQSQGKTGEEHVLAFEDFENLALIKTYNTNSQVPDSAGTATAIMSGYKTNIGAVNVEPGNPADMVRVSCVEKDNPPTLLNRAKAKGLNVGTISTARLTHATPAALYSHSVSRGWEADRDVQDGPPAEAGCISIAQQLIESELDLALGGGRGEFTDEQITAWGAQDRQYVTNNSELISASGKTPILGLFNRSHMSYEADREGTDEPSLAEMTEFAIDKLSSDEGFVLMVEAGRVDHAHHGSNAYRAMRDMQALNEAVKVAKAKTGDDTLIMVTADHSHVFTIAGYPVRGNPILGLVKGVDRTTGQAEADYTLADDGKPYTTLGYHNGANLRLPDSPALTDNVVQAKDFQQQVTVPLGSETHGGEDVPLYARGPGAENFKGVMEQDEIGKILARILESKD